MYTIGYIVRDMKDVQDVKNVIESIEHWHCTIEEAQAKMRNVESAVNRCEQMVVYFDFYYNGIYFGYDYMQDSTYEEVLHKCKIVPHNVLELHSELGKFELQE